MVTRRVSGGRGASSFVGRTASPERGPDWGVRPGGGWTYRTLWRKVGSTGAEIRGGGEGFLEDAFDSGGKVTEAGEGAPSPVIGVGLPGGRWWSCNCRGGGCSGVSGA